MAGKRAGDVVEVVQLQVLCVLVGHCHVDRVSLSFPFLFFFFLLGYICFGKGWGLACSWGLFRCLLER